MLHISKCRETLLGNTFDKLQPETSVAFTLLYYNAPKKNPKLQKKIFYDIFILSKFTLYFRKHSYLTLLIA